MDGHEFTFYGVTEDGYMKNAADDMQSKSPPASPRQRSSGQPAGRGGRGRPAQERR
ncbi:MAG: hypothetical protein ACLUJG_08415 [Lawsonibacter sp.]